MKDNFIGFILTIVIILIISCLGILGFNIYKDYIDPDKASSVEEWFGNTVQVVKEKIDEQGETETIGNIEGIQTASQNMQYSSESSTNNYLYKQLDDISKTIYNGLQNNKENLKTGTYSIEFGNSFSNILSQDNGQKILGGYYQSAIEAFLYDNPDVFYLNPNKMFLNVESTTYRKKVTYNVFINNGDQASYFADGFTSKTQIEQCESQINSVTNQILSNISGSTYDKVKKIHDILVNNLEYDSTVSKPHIYNIYGALVNRQCVCEGYAKSFKYLLDKAGINCVIVIGKATNSKGQTENHSWDYVQIDGNWYAVDVTWDDPVITGSGILTHENKYKYFLKGYSSISSDHTASGQFTDGGKVFSYPPLASRNY